MPNAATPMVQCENLIKIYKTKDIEVLALQGLELVIDRGELMAIIGNSGSGKSTFLNMIGGLDRPSAGQLIVDDKDLFKLGEKELVAYKRTTVGFVWQNNARNLLPWLSAMANVQAPMLFDKGKQRKERALELLDLVGLSHRKNSRLSQLSGGEQQRVAIAIALANQPKLLLADEPTGSVDAATARYIFDVFRKLNRELKLTIAIVTHDRTIAGMVDRVVSIRDGKTSSERVTVSSLEGVSDLSDTAKQEEFAVLDRAGRVQIPRDLLESIGVTGNRVRMNAEDGRIIIEPPEREETPTDAPIAAPPVETPEAAKPPIETPPPVPVIPQPGDKPAASTPETPSGTEDVSCAAPPESHSQQVEKPIMLPEDARAGEPAPPPEPVIKQPLHEPPEPAVTALLTPPIVLRAKPPAQPPEAVSTQEESSDAADSKKNAQDSQKRKHPWEPWPDDQGEEW